MRERIYFLKDMSENCVDAVIIATKSSKKEIEDAIVNAKQNNDYTWDDIVKSLPNDCKIYDRWNNEEEIYY